METLLYSLCLPFSQSLIFVFFFSRALFSCGLAVHVYLICNECFSHKCFCSQEKEASYDFTDSRMSRLHWSFFIPSRYIVWFFCNNYPKIKNLKHIFSNTLCRLNPFCRGVKKGQALGLLKPGALLLRMLNRKPLLFSSKMLYIRYLDCTYMYRSRYVYHNSRIKTAAFITS